ncbi:hypothetical protein INS49_005576 [Diaporthe citri]|uniref:uncharacterized protein n=1 Tax=Diaporthe citri TaxID=83186 RepID=UPI001C8172F4|nr:uncharacterized protein INS49_005576 [Diaporthe citri]KAG6353614.1 hypothetical protein INS49_005576 [Diaporthe citri]
MIDLVRGVQHMQVELFKIPGQQKKSPLQVGQSICVRKSLEKRSDDEENPEENTVSGFCYLVDQCFTPWFALRQFLEFGILAQPFPSEKTNVAVREMFEPQPLADEMTKSSLKDVPGTTRDAYFHMPRLCDGLQNTNDLFVVFVVLS